MKLFTQFLLLLTCLSTTAVQAQFVPSPWTDVEEANLRMAHVERPIIPNIYRTVSLDWLQMKPILEAAPMRFSVEAATNPVYMDLPMPDGSMQQFKIVDAPIMHPDLADKFPQMHAYAGQGVDDPRAFVRFGYTQNGFHAMIMSSEQSTVFIDPYAKGDTGIYMSYYKKDYSKRADDNFQCHVDDQLEIPEAVAQNSAAALVMGGDCSLRTYRLALACTAEYASFHGGTEALVMAEYNVSMVRVNGVYERDFAITMELVPNTNQLIYYTNPDPYTNGNGGTMLGQNISNCNAVIGSANYDIGHVYSTGGGGVAYLNSPCTGNKAGGVTGQGAPINDPFYIDYVAHEMGHQYGGNHTQNNSCNRNNSTSMEPGSASTIMGYAGICAPNVQNNSDDYFHAISVQEIYENITNGSGSTCPVVQNMPNQPPVVTVANTNYNVPISTPFMLTASATDPDGDALTYCWDQMDAQAATMPPVSTNTGGPAFRSFDPEASPTRYFPRLSDLVTNTDFEWEELPSVSRNMNFRCVVRDNHMLEGCTDEVDVDLAFSNNSGPFVVQNPNTNVTLNAGANETITWDVANTTAAPVSCANVDILLSTDGGFTYPITIMSNVPNDGSQVVSIPNNPTTTARIMVVCSDNIFFDISNQNFTIESSMPTFAMTASPETQASCNTQSVSYTIDLQGIAGFSENVSLSATGTPPGANVNFSPSSLTPTGTSTLTLSGMNGSPAGDYTITINANGTSISQMATVSLSLAAGTPVVQQLDTPQDEAVSVSTNPTFAWQSVSGATAYTIQISTNPSFAAGSIVETASVSVNSFSPTTALANGTVYYWQVSAVSLCGSGGYNQQFAFQTNSGTCTTYTQNSPTTIPDDTGGEVTSTLNVGGNLTIDDINVSVDIAHTYVGDILGSLTAPSGAVIQLFDQPGVPASNFGCANNDILATFDDEATNTAADFEATCNGTTPTISGAYQPLTTLSNLDGQSQGGNWILTITDEYAQEDGGAINSWSLEICPLSAPPSPPNLIVNQTLPVPNGTNENITNSYLQYNTSGSAAAQMVYTVLSLPASGTLYLNGQALAFGDTFTQQDIDNGSVSYTHNGNGASTDSFNFSVQNDQTGWIPEATFNINITMSAPLSASATTQNDVSCNGGNDGSVSATTSGGSAPFAYSLNGGAFQNDNTFTGLSAGTYTITVQDNTGAQTTTNSTTVGQPNAVTISGNSNGNSITVNANGGTGAFQYNLNGGALQSSNTFANLADGIYTICAFDVNNCDACTQITVSTILPLIATAEVMEDVECNGDDDGAVEVFAEGGVEPYLYSLNGGTFQTSPLFDGLFAGSYTITVIDNTNEEFTINNIFINEPNALSASFNVSANTLTINANGGTPGYEYSIDNGLNVQQNGTFTNLANGQYNACAYDVNGCEICELITINNSPLTADATLLVDLVCNNAQNAVITVHASGGAAPYTYSLNGGTPQTEEDFTSLGAGTYTITAFDNTGASTTTNTIVIDNPPAIVLDVVIDGNMITINTTGGTNSYVYSLNNTNVQSSNTYSNLANGTYIVCAIDSDNCETCTTATINVAPPLVASAVLTTPVACTGGNKAVITVTASGGQPPYTYSINGGTAQNSNVFTDLSAGSYTITVFDSGTFAETSNTLFINDPTPVDVFPSATNDQVTIDANGGTGTFTYSIDGGDTYQNDNIFTDLANGTYLACAKDENNCEQCEEVIVSFNLLAASASLTEELDCFEGANASITVETTGGNPPYSYALNGGTAQNSNVFVGLSAGNYTITVFDSGNGEIVTNTIAITNPTELTINPLVNTNDVTINGNGGTGNLLYSIDGGTTYEANNTFNDLANGTYEGCVQDANGCSVCEPFTIDLEALVISTSITQTILCNGDQTGEITVSATGGEMPYSYALNGGNAQSSNVFDGLSAGTYDVEVSDNGNFSETTSITITQADVLTLNPVVNTNDLTVNADGGTGNYQYSIDGGDTYQSSNVFENLANGTYLVCVIDENECVSCDEVTVNLDALIISTTISGIILCNGDQTGEITVSATGGEMPYSYALNGGNAQASNVFDGLSAGTYDVEVSDNGNFSETTSITITQADVLTLNPVVNTNDLTVNADGGTGNYQYSIDGGDTYQSSNVFENLANGTYLVCVIDENECVSCDEVTVNLDALIISTTISGIILCNGDQTGEITVSATGGEMPYSYALNGGNAQASNVFDGLSAGTYDVEVSDNGNFSETTSITITQADVLTLNPVVNTNDLTVNADGGTGNYQYSIDGGDTYQSSNVFENLANGTYLVCVIDENECVSCDEVTVNLDALIISTTISGIILCNGDQTGEITVSATGGEMPYSYALNGGNAQSSNVFDGLSAGTYDVEVSDNGNFSETTSITITQADVLTLNPVVNTNDLTVNADGGTGNYQYSIDGGDTYQSSNVFENLANGTYLVCVIDENECVSCDEVTVNLDALIISTTISGIILCNGDQTGEITVSATGGEMPYSYALNGGNAQSSNVFDGLSAGTYDVEVSDNGSFSETTSITLTQADVLTLNPVVNTNDLTVNADGGTGNYQYSIDGGDTYQSSNVFENLANGTYLVCVIDENECVSCDEVTVDFTEPTELTFETTVVGLLCFDDMNGSITVFAAGGAPDYMYSLNGGTAQNNNVFDDLGAGTYDLAVTDNDGQSITQSYTITNPDELIINSAQVDDDSIIVDADGGTGTLSYSIDGGTTFQSSNTFEDLALGTYEVCVIDENECIVCTVVTVSADDLIVGASMTGMILCNGDMTGEITVNADGGMEPYSYALNGGTPQNSNVFSGLGAGTYTITVSDSGTFSEMTNTISITQADALQVAIEVLSDDIVINAIGGTGSLMYSADGGNSYFSSNVFNDLPNGTYNVCVQDENGCTECNNTIVAVNEMVINAEVTNILNCFGDNNGVITVNVAGGQEPYQYSMNGGDFQGSNVFTGLSAGAYMFTVIDAGSMQQFTSNIIIENPDEIVINASSVGFDITVVAFGGTGALSYSLDGLNYQASNVLTVAQNGTYQLFVQDANGCIQTQTIIVNANTFAAVLTIQQELDCFGDNSGCVEVQVGGGTAPYMIEMAQEFYTETIICDLTAGLYTAIVTDATGATITTNSVNLISPTAIEIEVEQACNELYVNAIGGTGDLVVMLNGEEIDNDETIEDLANGTYELIITDENMCTEMTNIIIDNVSEAAFSVSPVTCFGGMDGSFTVANVIGGTAPYQYSIDGDNFQTDPTFDNLEAGQYDVTIEDANGCELVQEINFSNPPELTATASVVDDAIIVNANGGTGDLMYSIDGVNYQTDNVFDNLPNGTYNIIVEDVNGCKTSLTATILVDGLTDITLDLFFQISPNPSSGLVTISMNMPTENAIELTLYDVAGKLLYTQELAKPQDSWNTSLDVQHLAAGSYLLMLNDGQQVGLERLLIVK